ncbi:BrnA antitoxin family protein [Exiguobacterium sp. s133]|uniref:BrnA antitoxin family protein n=1 Tax=Exiguobacterium sp. s133 TaxID=2751213 RepID=UPI001BE69FAB|nr:BrnA antitoxin family protein [Exiguobacterium sp. s133]
MSKRERKLLSSFGGVASEYEESVGNKEVSENVVTNNKDVNENDNSNVNNNDNNNELINNNNNDNKLVNNDEVYNEEEDQLNNEDVNQIDNKNEHQKDIDSVNPVDNIRVNDPKRKYAKKKSLLDNIVDDKKTKKQMAFYLDQDVIEAVGKLNTLGKGRIKSTFVNEVLREALEREGLL